MRIARWISVVLLAGLAMASPAVAQEAAPKHKPLAEDGLHDPDLPGVHLLQEPGDVLGHLPATTSGNLVDWNKAVRDGYIEPRATLLDRGEVKTLDLDIYLPNTGDAKVVRFPHLEHSEWLDCNNCHPVPFAEEVGATPMSMLEILMGEYCGICHGAVAFPLTECSRCHSVDYDDYLKIRDQQRR
ncbi:c(7)-type cytochrome triheme domain-containing protein [Halomonas alkalisoli]|uniref:c(7)-type cytochrome triheme domain-containing protein n=1 Tax=Halomonas alkalisoli TaxID=2907158 RepID=UPI001F4052A6|nr:c(7)-type cytochrome triheme domain-containing protein [Halomonas alkalisoli]MCE9682583.1 hypothetical protein [Halomonas alkalisoli]